MTLSDWGWLILVALAFFAGRDTGLAKGYEVARQATADANRTMRAWLQQDKAFLEKLREVLAESRGGGDDAG